jgi:hypothetical protein
MKREMNGNADSVRLMFQEVLSRYAWTQCGRRAQRSGTGTQHDGQGQGQGQGQAGEQPPPKFSVTRAIMKIPLVFFWQENCPNPWRGATDDDVETLLMRG